MENWKERYQKLAELNDKLLKQLQDVEYTKYQIRSYMDDCDRADLRDRRKHRFMRLKEDVRLKPEYTYGDGKEALFPKGTLINVS